MSDERNVQTWKNKLAGKLMGALEEEIDAFETNITLRKADKLEAKIFAEARLRRGAYGQRYDNGQRHDGVATQQLAYPCGDLVKGPETVWDAPGMMRIKIPFGGISSNQLRRVAEITDRYATGVGHVTTRQDIQLHFVELKDVPAIMRALAEVGLTINEEKTKIAYIDTFERRNVATSFTFLGYDFKVRTLRNYKGELFRKCMPGASAKAMRKIVQTIKHWRIHRSTVDDLSVLAQRHNAVVRGWIEYYGKFWYRNFSYRLWSAMQSRLLKWAQAKYRISTRQAERKLAQANPRPICPLSPKRSIIWRFWN